MLSSQWVPIFVVRSRDARRRNRKLAYHDRWSADKKKNLANQLWRFNYVKTMQEIFSRPLSYSYNDNLRVSEHQLCNIACIIHTTMAGYSVYLFRREGTLINECVKSFINGTVKVPRVIDCDGHCVVESHKFSHCSRLRIFEIKGPSIEPGIRRCLPR